MRPTAIRFAQFELRPQQRQLLANGRPLALGARAFDVLLALIETPGQLVHKHELLERVWPQQVVEEGNIPVQINALRKLLGKEVIATVPGRGYRFTALLAEEQAHPPAAPAVDASPSGDDRPPRAPVPPSDRVAQDQSAFATNLPGLLTRLVGRDHEQATLDALVGAHRLVTLVGPGGVGKSLLAQHLLTQHRARHRHGVCWVELAPARNVDAAIGAIGAAVGVSLGAGQALKVLGAALAPLQLLLALDNAEHLRPDVAGLVAHLLGVAPDLRILVTSQCSLGLPAEWVMRLAALSLPAPQASVDEARGHGAVALFVELAVVADVRFRLTPLNVASVIALCRALDGLPLAIQLAASRVRALGLAGVETSMRNRFRLLSANRDPGAPPRHQTLRAALEWSHALLGVTERCVFRRLAVLPDTISLDLLVKIVDHPDDDSGMDEWTALDALCVLVDRCLVEVVDGESPRPRYRLLESMRTLAREHLAASGEHEAACRRHAHVMAEHFDAMLQRRFDGTMGIAEWKVSMGRDLAHARAALTWLSGQGPAERVNVVRLGSAMLRAFNNETMEERLAVVDVLHGLLQSGLPARIEVQGRLAVERASTSTSQNASDEDVLTTYRIARQLALDVPDAQNEALWCLAVSRAVVRFKANPEGAPALLADFDRMSQRPWPPPIAFELARSRLALLMVQGASPSAILESAQMFVNASIQAGNGTLDNYSPMNALVDAQLAANDLAGAERSARRLVNAMKAGRNGYEATGAAINLLAALAGLGKVAQAQSVAWEFWDRVRRYQLLPYFCDHMALMLAVQAAHEAALLVIGWADAHYRLRNEARQTNEQRAVAQAWRLACQALGEPAALAARTKGAGLQETDIAALVFPAEAAQDPLTALGR